MQRLKRIIKNNSIASGAWYECRRLHNKFSIGRFAKLPVKADQILFGNFNGRGFACNPRAIAECLHKSGADVTMLWSCGDDNAEKSLPPYIKPIKYGTKEYFRALATSGVWVENDLLQDGISKKKDQLYVQTYHGERGFKKVGYDAFDNEKYQKVKNKRKIIEDKVCDFFIAGSGYGEKFIRSAFAYNGVIEAKGLPRNDCLIEKDAVRCADVRKRLNLTDDTKVALYAPTFRDREAVEGKIDTDIDLPRILSALKENYGGKWCCLLRAHGGKQLLIDRGQKLTDEFIDVTSFPDMADILLVTDFLITDYSSSSGDFALTGKPILLYQDDFEDYLENNRSLYFKMEDSPYFVAHNMEEAIKIIGNITEESAKENDKAILKFYETKETGHASENICRLIMNFIDSHEKL